MQEALVKKKKKEKRKTRTLDVGSKCSLSICLDWADASCISTFLVFLNFFIFYQRLLHCSLDMNIASRQMNSNPCMNSNFYYFFIIFNKISGIQMHQYFKNK